MLEIRNLSKKFETKEALKSAFLEIPQSIIFGFLGPNGAGKSTLMRILVGITDKDEGQIFWNGKEISYFSPEQIGYLPEERGLYPDLYVMEHIFYFGKLRGVEDNELVNRAKHWLDYFDLTAQQKQKVKSLSKGMQQKLQLICSFIHYPKVLILDEPFSGLDPINMHKLEVLLPVLRKEYGIQLIILSTHQMELAESLCEQIALINDGRIMLQGEIDVLKEEYFNYEYFLETDKPVVWEEIQFPYQLKKIGDTKFVVQTQKSIYAQDVSHWLEPTYRILRFQRKLPTLKDIFIKVVS